MQNEGGDFEQQFGNHSSKFESSLCCASVSSFCIMHCSSLLDTPGVLLQRAMLSFHDGSRCKFVADVHDIPPCGFMFATCYDLTKRGRLPTFSTVSFIAFNIPCSHCSCRRCRRGIGRHRGSLCTELQAWNRLLRLRRCASFPMIFCLHPTTSLVLVCSTCLDLGLAGYLQHCLAAGSGWCSFTLHAYKFPALDGLCFLRPIFFMK